MDGATFDWVFPFLALNRKDIKTENSVNIYATLVVLAIYTGMRRGEVLALRWQDCNLEEKKISIRQTLYRSGTSKLQFQEPKTKGSKRVLSLPDYAIACLRKHKAEQNEIKLRLGSAYNDHDLSA
ncbi:site-specific integrase [Aneurinibacillus aneurinilyticus]|jgi:integrase|nr:site-specific integrase [Aneurinibacillus aneurinilyticus]